MKIIIFILSITTYCNTIVNACTSSDSTGFKLSGFNGGPDNLTFSQTVSPLTSQNKVYKRRLDSLQKTIPLTCNKYVQNHIDSYIATPSRKKQVGKLVGLSKYYFPIFEKALREVGVPDEIKFITIMESALDPHAASYAGAIGLWQFMSATAKGYGLRMDSYVDERKDPIQASYAAATYLKDVYNQFGDWLLALAAYNCGTSVVLKAIEKSGGVADFWHIRPYLPKQTQNYIPAFIATNYVMNYYKKHDIAPLAIGLNKLTEAILVHNVVSLSSIAKAANLDLAVLRTLNPSYKKHIINGSKTQPKLLITPVLSQHVYAPIYDVLNTKMVYKSTPQSTAIIKRSPGIKKKLNYKAKPKSKLSLKIN